MNIVHLFTYNSYGNGGFSQRICRQIKLFYQINSVNFYGVHFLSFHKYLNMSLKKRIQNHKSKYINKNYINLNIIYTIPRFRLFNSYCFYYWITSKLLYYKVKTMEIDLIYAENLKAGYIAYQFFLRYKIPYILDYHGVVPEEFKEFNLKHKAIEKEYRYLKKMEKTTIENAKKIICVSHYFKNYLCMNFDLKSENIIVVPSCIDQQKIAFSNSMRFKYRERLKLTDENVFIYNGSFTPYQCIEKMILFFSILLKFEKKIFFIFLVTSNLKDVEDLFKKYHVQNDKYTIKSVNHFEVVNYQMAADFGLIIRDDSLVNRVASPTKIFEYLSTGLKLISTDNIGDIDILNIEKYVLSTNDINEDYIMENYINILKKYDRNDNFNKCKIELMEKYIWDSYINDYENIFKN